jgi:hypothetical protein
MALGKRRRERQLEAFVVASDLPKSPGHPFYTALNRLLAENGFDPLVEKLCAPYYAETMGRPRAPPSIFFRILFSYFEELTLRQWISGLRSVQRLRSLPQIAWIHFERLLSALDRLVAMLFESSAKWSRAIGG